MKSLFRHKILTLLAGIATAVLIVFSQLFYFQAANYCQKKAETEQQAQKKDGNETHISIPSSTISSSSHIEITQDLSFRFRNTLRTRIERRNRYQNFSSGKPVLSNLIQVYHFAQRTISLVLSP